MVLRLIVAIFAFLFAVYACMKATGAKEDFRIEKDCYSHERYRAWWWAFFMSLLLFASNISILTE